MIRRNQFVEEQLDCRYVGTTVALIAAGVALAGAATSAYGSYSSGQAQKASAEYNAKVAQNNALAASQQAAFDANQQRIRTRRLQGAQAAALAKAGVGEGSGTDVMYDSTTQGEMNALLSMYKGGVSASSSRAQQTLYGYQGQSAATAGNISAAGSLLSGAGNATLTYSAIRNNQPDFGY